LLGALAPPVLPVPAPMPLVNHFEYAAFSWSLCARTCDVFHETGSTERFATPSEKDRAMAI